MRGQKKYAEVLPPPVYREGDSQGFTFAIKKNGQTRGYLHGTMHHLEKFKDGEKAAKIAEVVQKRLFECAILGTEITLATASKSISVDKTLVMYASERGIPNLGMDAENRYDLLPDSYVEILKNTKVKDKPSDDDTIIRQEFDKSLLSAYRSGDLMLMGMLDALINGKSSEKEIEFNSLRSEVMAENMDNLLKACEEVGGRNGRVSLEVLFCYRQRSHYRRWS